MQCKLKGQGVNGIKSVQRGETRITAASQTVTLTTSIDVTRSIVLAKVRPYVGNTAATAAYVCVKATLTNSTTLTFAVNTYSASYAPYVEWEVIEFDPAYAKPKQEGTTASVAGTTTATLTTAVDTTKAIVAYSFSNTNTSAYNYYCTADCVLTNSTTLTIGALYTGFSVHWEVIDFY
jgi:hypothetical protein